MYNYKIIKQMITFLWMLYLAFTLCMTIGVIVTSIDYFFSNIADETMSENIFNLKIITCCLLWSIWYFYFLH